MKERFPAIRKGSAEHEAFVANIQMPQTFAFIKTAMVLGAIEETGFKGVAERLTQTLDESDPSIAAVAKKANAQHDFHEIGKELTSADIIRVNGESRGQALNLLERLIDVEREKYLVAQQTRPDLIFETWLDEEVEAYKHKDLILGFLRSYKKAVASPDVVEAIQKYKDEYKNWKHKDASERHESNYEVSRLLKEARLLILSKISEDMMASSETRTAEENQEVSRLLNMPEFKPN